MPGVEPGVADLGDARHLLPALVAGDDDVVDPRPVQLAQAVEPADGALLELGPRADHRQVAACARVERQRQAEVPLARDVPVAHVPQPVVHPLRVEGRRPLDRRVRVEHRLPDLLGGDEPVVDDAEEERRLAAPARRIAVDDPPGLDEEPALAEASRPRAPPPHRPRCPPAPRSCRRRRRTRRSARAPAARARGPARSPRCPRRARCGRCPCPRRARRRPTG